MELPIELGLFDKLCSLIFFKNEHDCIVKEILTYIQGKWMAHEAFLAIGNETLITLQNIGITTGFFSGSKPPQ